MAADQVTFCSACFNEQRDPFHKTDTCPNAAQRAVDSDVFKAKLEQAINSPPEPLVIPQGTLVAPVSAEEPVDAVSHPAHYARWKMEPIEFIAINDLPWWVANIIKYTMRYDAKDGLQDLRKARSYLDMKIRHLEGHERFWDKPVTEERNANGAA